MCRQIKVFLFQSVGDPRVCFMLELLFYSLDIWKRIIWSTDHAIYSASLHCKSFLVHEHQCTIETKNYEKTICGTRAGLGYLCHLSFAFCFNISFCLKIDLFA